MHGITMHIRVMVVKMWPHGLRRRSAAARLLQLGVESRRRHGPSFLTNVVCASAASLSLVPDSPAEHVCVFERDQMQQ